jgi:hypothetical protein
MIRNHNLESDYGVHTYTNKMNQFGDMVCLQYFSLLSSIVDYRSLDKC